MKYQMKHPMGHPGALKLTAWLIVSLVFCVGLNVACNWHTGKEKLNKIKIEVVGCGFAFDTCMCQICSSGSCGFESMPSINCWSAKEK